MRAWQFEGILVDDKWLQPGYLTVDESGRVKRLSNECDSQVEICEQVAGWLIPGFQNAHSHVFQYAMAGLAEHLPQGAGGDDFWSWRNAMYRFAHKISPEALESIATMAYAEMVRLGWTAVAEFHYLHNDPNGDRYSDSAVMAESLCRAAQTAGMDLTLVPIFYRLGNFGQPAQDPQRRFTSRSAEDFLKLWEQSKAVVETFGFKIAMGVHSLRAADLNDMKLLEAHSKSLPFHLHISEQLKEVADCQSHYGKRPVQWLLENLSVSERWHLVHATHLVEDEIRGIVQSNANVVLCPSTEGNLGDGIFPLCDYLELGGRWSVGTDSHVGLCPLEELRWLDYVQRLISKKRNPLCFREGDDSGFRLFRLAYQNGRRAMGERASGPFFVEGCRFNGIVIDCNYPLFAARETARRLSTLIFAADASAILGTIVGGKWVTQNRKHLKYDKIHESFVRTLQTC